MYWLQYVILLLQSPKFWDLAQATKLSNFEGLIIHQHLGIPETSLRIYLFIY